MIFTEQVIRECIAKGITNKRAIAKEMVRQDPSIDAEGARYRVRKMLGSAGNPVAGVHMDLYQLYMNVLCKNNEYEKASHKKLTPSKTYIITTALNSTPIHKPFWDNLLAYARFKGAEVHVIASRYKNPNSVFSDAPNDVWCAEVLPYLDANRHDLFDGIQLMSDVKIQPTAVTPLSGLNGLSASESCIFGHPRVHMQFMPVPKGHAPKIMMTTGACTLPNYTDSKTGKKGEFHHTYGFVIVTDGDMHYVTACDDGSFIDMDKQVISGEVVKAPQVEALILGDLHTAKLSQEARIRIRSRIIAINPKMLILHDVMDAESVNPHEEKNPILKVKRFESGRNSLANEIEDTLEYLSELNLLCDDIRIIPSNHDNMIDRYIANMDWKKDIPNALKYAELLPIALREPDGVFPYLVRELGIVATKVDDSIVVCGIELNLHGDRGANGSRGSSVQFKNLSSKTVTAHSHTPSRQDGSLVVGCQDLEHGYNLGLSSWGVGDVIINGDGKCQHIF